MNYKAQATATFSILALLSEIWAFKAKKSLSYDLIMCWHLGSILVCDWLSPSGLKVSIGSSSSRSTLGPVYSPKFFSRDSNLTTTIVHKCMRMEP